MRRYELSLVADPTIPEEQHDRLITQLEEMITERSGKVLKVDRWGRRKLAYKVKGQTEGNYTFLLFDGDAALLTELERRLRLSENWLRFLTVRADHEKPPTDEELEALNEAREEQIRRAKEREERERLAREQAEAEGEPEEGEAEEDPSAEPPVVPSEESAEGETPPTASEPAGEEDESRREQPVSSDGGDQPSEEDES